MTEADVSTEFHWRLNHCDRNQDPARLWSIWHLLSQTIAYRVPGDAVELGCFQGHTSVFLKKTLLWLAPEKELHLFDSFQGLPELGPEDAETQHPHLIRRGAVACPKAAVDNYFAARDCPLPRIVPGWFRETLPQELPGTISFALLDGDLYDSIQVSLREVWPRLSPGGIVVVDDYSWNGCPGCTQAVDEFFADKPGCWFKQFGVVQGFGRKPL